MEKNEPIVFVIIQQSSFRDEFLSLAFEYPRSALITNYGNGSSHEAVLTRLAGIPSLINLNAARFIADKNIIKLESGRNLSAGDIVVIDGSRSLLGYSDGKVLEEDDSVFDISHGIDIKEFLAEVSASFLKQDGAAIREEVTLDELAKLNAQAWDEYLRIKDGADKVAIFKANLKKHAMHNLLLKKEKEESIQGVISDVVVEIKRIIKKPIDSYPMTLLVNSIKNILDGDFDFKDVSLPSGYIIQFRPSKNSLYFDVIEKETQEYYITGYKKIDEVNIALPENLRAEFKSENIRFFEDFSKGNEFLKAGGREMMSELSKAIERGDTKAGPFHLNYASSKYAGVHYEYRITFIIKSDYVYFTEYEIVRHDQTHYKTTVGKISLNKILAYAQDISDSFGKLASEIDKEFSDEDSALLTDTQSLVLALNIAPVDMNLVNEMTDEAMVSAKELILYSGPSATGKSPLWEQIKKRYPDAFERIVLYTSRDMRPGEKEGVDYRFRSREEIQKLAQKGNFVIMSVHDDLQAINLDDVKRAVESRKQAIAEVSADWAQLLRNRYSDKVYSIFIAPLSEEEIASRMSKRNINREEVIYREMIERQKERSKEMPTASAKQEKRATAAIKEMNRRDEYDVVIVSDKLRDIGEHGERWDGKEGKKLVGQFMELAGRYLEKATLFEGVVSVSSKKSQIFAYAQEIQAKNPGSSIVEFQEGMSKIIRVESSNPGRILFKAQVAYIGSEPQNTGEKNIQVDELRERALQIANKHENAYVIERQIEYEALISGEDTDLKIEILVLVEERDPDKAMLTETQLSNVNLNEVGGIDLNNIEMDFEGDGGEIIFDSKAFEPLLNMDIKGFSPVIINITPINSVLLLLGLNVVNDSDSEDDTDSIQLSEAIKEEA
ncbi:MAG: hypothetical protein P9X22_02125 [Candidatus Zapsychrus exili]|nr:hypothetical protein [Candidatus Zapsychrus exili]